MNIVRFWKDARYRRLFSLDEQAVIPANPAGDIEIDIAVLTSRTRSFNKTTRHPQIGGITVQRLSYSCQYAPSSTLHDISFEVKPGQLVAILTSSQGVALVLARLLVGLYAPSGGGIYYSGVASRLVPPHRRRHICGYVSDKGFLFNGSVLQNIACNDPSASFEQIVEATTSAGLHQLVLELPEHYETVVDPRSRNLTPAFRQKLLLARALVVQPLNIILHGSMHALSVEELLKIYNNLRLTRRSQIIVNGRKEIYKEADLVVFLQEGIIVAQGHHANLLERNEAYRTAYQLLA